MITTTILNAKGGVGKSTTALNLGTGLARKGYKVLLVDLDSQGNLTSMAQPIIQDDYILEVLLSKPVVMEIEHLSPTSEKGLYVLPNRGGVTEGVFKGMSELKSLFVLKYILSNLENKIDFVLIDNSPTEGKIVYNSLNASQYILIPIQYEQLSIDGVLKVMHIMNEVKEESNPDIKLLGILGSIVQHGRVLNREVQDIIEQSLPGSMFQTQIKEAQSIRESKNVYISNNVYGIADFNSLVKEFLQRIKK